MEGTGGRMKSLGWLLAFGMLFAMECRAQPATALESLLGEAHRAGRFNGVALVAQRGRVVVRLPLGPADATRATRLTAGHRFNLGSVSKEFSAALLMRLAERGRLSLDAPVSRVMRGLPAWADAVTPRMLLDYSSGLPELRWREIRNDADARADLERLAQTTFPPGTGHAYTYNNVMLRQFIVEELTHGAFADSLRTLFRRCGMRDSLVDPADDARLVARSYSDDFIADATFMPISGIAFVTAEDLYRWSRCLNSGRALSEQSLWELGQAQRQGDGALGNTRWEGRRLAAHSHQGESRNYEALLRYDARLDSTIVLLSNNKQQQLQAIAEAVEELLARD
jgi:CubicO group peptidase (beta-lactamase class C family)